MTSRRALRYGVGLAIAHFMLIAILIPLEVRFRTSRLGAVAFRIHYIADAPVWNAPRLASHIMSVSPIKNLTLLVFPGPNASAAIIGLELLVFGVAGGVLYFFLGVTCAILVGMRTATK
jgi:hypothetical protein